jgi:mono/diheme cytochrome c family protein
MRHRLLATALLALGGVSSAADTLSADDTGAALYERHCVSCHAPAGWGSRRLASRLGPKRPAVLNQRSDLNPLYVAFVIRHGLGPMPPFIPTELSALAVSRIVEFLTHAAVISEPRRCRSRQARTKG